MPKPDPKPTYAPIDLDKRVLRIRKQYEDAKKITDLAKAKRPFFGSVYMGYTYFEQRRKQIELLEKLAGMVNHNTTSQDHGYRYNIGAYQLLMTACFLIRKQIENEEYSFKHTSYGTLHKLIGEALDVPLGNKLEKKILDECLNFVTQVNPKDYDMPGKHRIPPEIWAKLKKLATDLQLRIARKEKQPGACEKVLGLGGYVLMPFGWAFGYFAGVAFSFSTKATPMVNALAVVFSGLFGLAARQGGGSGRASSMLLSRPCAEQVASYGFGYAGAMLGSTLAYHVGKKGGGFLGWLIDSGSDVAAQRIAALYVSLQKKEQMPVRYGYDLQTGDLVFFNVDGDVIDMSDVLNADNIEEVIRNGQAELSETDESVIQAFAKDLERLRPQLLELEKQRQEEQEQADEITRSLAAIQ